MIKRPFPTLSRQFLRFIVVGLLSTIVNYGLFYGLLSGGLHYQLASALGFLAGVGIGYPLNKKWTYDHKEEAGKKLKAKYLAVYMASLGLSLAFLYLTVDLWGIDARLANLLAIGLTTMTNFIGTKFLVFRK